MDDKEDNRFPAVVEGRIGDDLVQTVNARDLHTFLKVGKMFAHWIKERIEQYGFAENVDYVVFAETGNNPQGGRPAKEYAITIDMAKELSMVERNEQGKKARLYFLACERKLKVVRTPAEMLLEQARMMVEVERKQAALEAEQTAQARRIATTERRLDQIETATDHFTCVGYARWAKQTSIDLKQAADLGRRAAKRCREMGIPISKIPDPRFGAVNQFPKAILDEVWEEVFGRAA